MIIILCALAALAGYVIALKTVWFVQLAVFIAACLYTKHNRSFQELAAVVPLIGTILLAVGMVLGNIVYLIAHPDASSFQSFTNGLSWLFTP